MKDRNSAHAKPTIGSVAGSDAELIFVQSLPPYGLCPNRNRFRVIVRVNGVQPPPTRFLIVRLARDLVPLVACKDNFAVWVRPPIYGCRCFR